MADDSHLRLRLQNTFLHAVDITIEAQRLSRSKSDSSLPSLPSLPSSQRSKGGPDQSAVIDADHIVFGTPSSSFSLSERGRSKDSSQTAPAPVKQSVDFGARSESEHGGLRKSTEQSLSERTTCWSAGASLHQSEECRPCVWHWKPEGCESGAACPYCHMCDQNALRSAVKGRRKARPRRHRGAQHALPEKKNISLAQALLIGVDEPQLNHVAGLECRGVVGMSAGS